ALGRRAQAHSSASVGTPRPGAGGAARAATGALGPGLGPWQVHPWTRAPGRPGGAAPPACGEKIASKFVAHFGRTVKAKRSGQTGRTPPAGNAGRGGDNPEPGPAGRVTMLRKSTAGRVRP